MFSRRQDRPGSFFDNCLVFFLGCYKACRMKHDRINAKQRPRNTFLTENLKSILKAVATKNIGEALRYGVISPM